MTKLTLTQADVIRRMREGGILIYEVISGYYFLTNTGGKVRHKTICKLREAGLIKLYGVRRDTKGVLTDLGKSIDLGD